SRVLLGSRATRAAVLEALARARVVHLAGHGWDAGEAPPLGGIRLDEGWLAAVDLVGRPGACDLVVLAACRTGTPVAPRVGWGVGRVGPRLALRRCPRRSLDRRRRRRPRHGLAHGPVSPDPGPRRWGEGLRTGPRRLGGRGGASRPRAAVPPIRSAPVNSMT